ncbi:hypothetical protein ACFC0C_15720 [Streptomyces sp. NPDC056178]|uniref:hypothetical protein n=1 Tax=unclassified Streptomyces TaxID=2593676 RepID=UPI0035D57C84
MGKMQVRAVVVTLAFFAAAFGAAGTVGAAAADRSNALSVVVSVTTPQDPIWGVEPTDPQDPIWG